MKTIRILLLGVASAAALLAGQACLAPETLFALTSVSGPELRPDGSAVAFTYSWTDIQDDSSYSVIKILRNGITTTLNAGKIHEHSPHWSPDGKYLAYSSDRSGKSRVHILEFDSRRERVLENIDRGVSNVAWSPDGKWLAFFSFVDGTPEWNPPMPLKPAGAKWAPPPIAITTMRYAMDGSGVMLPGSTQLFVALVDGGAPRQISHLPYWHTSYLTTPELAWSHDSRSVLSTAVQNAEGWTVLNESNIYAFPIDSGTPRRLGRPGWHQHGIAASPDGKHIAFTGFEWKGQSHHVPHLYTMDADGSNWKSLTGSIDREVQSPAWSADGRRLWFIEQMGGDWNLRVANMDGELSDASRGRQRISSLSLAHNGRAVALLSTPTQPGAVVELALDARQNPKVLFDPNAELLSGCRPLAPEQIGYRSFDGREIEGWLLKPRGFDASLKYPLLVSIHGGPHSAYGNYFMHDLQVFAEHGYVVLYVNPRGSTGYGEKFAAMIQHKWPGDDITDVLAGVDYAIAKGYIDPTRMAVVGGSGGGLMTTWTVTQTTRFRAAVAWWPVTNWFTHVGSADNGFYIGTIFRKALPWDDPQDYIDHSPLFQVKKVKTPTMIITGEEDWRVPIAQSGEFYRALKEVGVDTVFIRVPGESHGSLKRTSHRIAVLVNTLAWLDRYIDPKARSGG